MSNQAQIEALVRVDQTREAWINDPEGLIVNLEAYQQARGEALALGCTEEQVAWPDDRDVERDQRRLSVELEHNRDLDRGDDRDDRGR